MMQMKDSLALAVLLTGVLCFPLHTHAGGALVQYDPHQLREVEKRLRDYLSRRVLVFRKGEIGRHRITFDSPRGHPSAESGSALRSRPNAILSIDLTVGPEHLVILVEAVQTRSGVSRPSFVRNPPKIQTGYPYNHPRLPHVTCLIYSVIFK